ncbi:MAG TPA: PLDc N-terminal domain-containing protein, partial [Acidimicrobiales bacterium]|nr:PLDc N-terminal domain-containing protein [Acidimicrobiales bacterium]
DCRRYLAMLAYTWPLLSLLWTFLMFAGVVLLLFFIIWCFVDNFRRRDHSGWAKAGWTILILLIPFIGALIYIIARPADAILSS